MTNVASETTTEQTPDNTKLDVADIMRLIKAAKSAGYVQSADGHVKPNGPFKTVTLKDMAKRNSQTQNQTPVTETASAENQAEPLIDDSAPLDVAESEDSLPADTSPEQGAETAGTEQEPSLDDTDKANLDAKQIADTLSNDPAESSRDRAEMPEPDAAASPEEGTDHPETDLSGGTPEWHEGHEDQTGFKTTLAPTDPSQAEPVAEGQNIDYQRGFEEGQAAAKQELEASLGEAITSFQTTATALGKDDNIDLSQLDQAMTKAIIQLASTRAGMAIDENPQGFTTRIETMVSRIRNRINEPIIHLHPQDAEAIQTHLEERLAPREIKIIADETLKRGDARVDVGSIGVMDLIDDQVSLKPVAKAKKDAPEDV